MNEQPVRSVETDALRIAGRRHDLVPVIISDPLEETFPSFGIVDMEDPETGERLTPEEGLALLQSNDTSVRKRLTAVESKLQAKAKADAPQSRKQPAKIPSGR